MQAMLPKSCQVSCDPQYLYLPAAFVFPPSVDLDIYSTSAGDLEHLAGPYLFYPCAHVGLGGGLYRENVRLLYSNGVQTKYIAPSPQIFARLAERIPMLHYLAIPAIGTK